MLPSNLLVARVRGGRVEPLLLKPEGIPLAIASEVLERIRGGVGKSRGTLLAEAEDLMELALEAGMDLRVVKAMLTLALRASRFERPRLPLDPVRARLEVYEAAASMYGVAVTEGEREAVLERVAARLGCSAQVLEELISSQADEVLAEPPSISAEELVRRYNLSAVQTLLFRALRLEAAVVADGATVKRLLRAVKLLGLLYMAERAGRGVSIAIDGPASLLRQTRRYGTRLAKLVPYVMQAEEWSIRADIEGRGRTLTFELDDSSSGLFPKLEPELEPLFDSELEREFYRSLSALAPGWTVRREPEPLVAGGRILIPDFSVSRGDQTVYIEILGFWTREYLERKLEKLRELRGVKVVVAVNEELACSSLKELPHEVVVFKRRLRGADVYPVLKRLLGGPAREGAEEGGVAPLDLPDLDGKPLSEALKVLKARGVEEDRAVKVLESLGYTVEWTSLDPSSAVVRKKRGS